MSSDWYGFLGMNAVAFPKIHHLYLVFRLLSYDHRVLASNGD